MIRPWTAVAVASALVLVALGGCSQISEKRLEYTRTENVKITKITVRPGSGDVVIRTADAQTVQIKRLVRYRGAEPDGTNYRIDGTDLVVDTDCGRQCGVSYDIVAPRGVSVSGENGSGEINVAEVDGVDVKVGSGGITVRGATGPVRAETGSGDVSISDARQTVSAVAGSGDVTGRGLGGGEVTVRTGSGEINLSLDRAGPVRAEASSGTVNLTVPPGTYRVRAVADSGERQVRVTEDPASTVLLDVHSGSGDVTITQS
ncbi:DUF4097 family beta strand repeat-containing protein [Micromonospora zhanjiangensis]